VGVTASGGLALHWNGRSWKQVMTPPSSFLAGVSFIPPSRQAWAVGNTALATLILRWNGTAWH